MQVGQTHKSRKQKKQMNWLDYSQSLISNRVESSDNSNDDYCESTRSARRSSSSDIEESRHDSLISLEMSADSTNTNMFNYSLNKFLPHGFSNSRL